MTGYILDASAWLQVALIILFWLAFILRNLITRFSYHRSPIVFGRDTRGVVRIVEFGLPLFSLVLVVETVLFAQGSSLLPESINVVLFGNASVVLVGLVFEALAIGLFAMASRQMKSSWRAGVDNQASDPLISTGLFAFSRNPVYLAMFLFLFGAILVTGTSGIIAYAATGLGLIHFQVLQEETALEERFGENYDAYRAKVPRYLFL